MSVPRLVFISFMLVAFLVSAPAFAMVSDGEIVVLEQGNTSNPAVPAALIGIDPVTGNQTLISSGGLLGGTGFVYDPSSNSFFVLGRGGLIQVDANTGAQTTITPGAGGYTIAMEPNGDFLFGDLGMLSCSNGDTIDWGYIAGIRVWGVQIDDQTGDAIVSGGSPLSGAPTGGSVIRVNSSQQTLITSITPGWFQDFALSGNAAYIAVRSLGLMAQVEKLDLTTGQLTPLFGGLHVVLDVKIDSQGRLVILDGCEFLTPCAGSPVVYRSNSSGGLDVLSTGGYMFVPARLAIVSTTPPPVVRQNASALKSLRIFA